MKMRSLLYTGVGALFFMSLFFSSCVEIIDELNQAPTCKITYPENGSVFVQQDVITLKAIANDSDGYVQTVKFYVDNNEIGETGNYPYEVFWNSYGYAAGTHNIKAVATDDSGNTGSDEISVELVELGTTPVADFVADVTTGTAPMTVHFTDKSLNSPLSWVWDFGDGTTGNEQNPVHVYQNEGTYSVTLTVSNNAGSNTKTKDKYILVNPGGFQTFTDPRDGKTYKIVNIGDQTWFAENLNYETAGSWYYNDDEQYGNIYGRLYTWKAASTACPDGWHLASDGEWKALEKYVGMSDEELDKEGMRGTDEGAKLKSPNYWSSGVGLNTVGFSALPGGHRMAGGVFTGIEEWGKWWTYTEHDDGSAWFRSLHYHYKGIERLYSDKAEAYSVRCIKD